MTQSQYGEWESRGETVDAAVFSVASRHHIHGVQCLCGFESHRARSRTEHIIDATLAALADGGVLGKSEGEAAMDRINRMHEDLSAIDPSWYDQAKGGAS